MRRFIVGAVVALLSIAPASADTFTDLRDDILKHTVQINGNCSGTLIYSQPDDKTGDVLSVVLTAKHCVPKSGRDVAVDFQVYQGSRVVKKESYIATVRGKSYKSDLALIELKDKTTVFETTAKVSAGGNGINVGDRVYTAGYPMGLSLTITEGRFVSAETINWPQDGSEFYRATADIIGGNSGGGMYHETEGGDYVLVGVAAAVIRGAPFMGFYTSADDIYDYLKVALPGAVGIHTLPKPKPGVSK